MIASTLRRPCPSLSSSSSRAFCSLLKPLTASRTVCCRSSKQTALPDTTIEQDARVKQLVEEAYKQGFEAAKQEQAQPDSVLRSAVKGFIWRIFSTSATVSIALLIFKENIKVQDALELGGLEFVTKYILYFLHERLWANIKSVQ